MIPAPLVGPALTDPQTARTAQPVPAGAAADAFARLLSAAGMRPDAPAPDLPVVPPSSGGPAPGEGAAASGEPEARTPEGADPAGREGDLIAPPSVFAEGGAAPSGSLDALITVPSPALAAPVGPIGGPNAVSAGPVPMSLIVPGGAADPAREPPLAPVPDGPARQDGEEPGTPKGDVTRATDEAVWPSTGGDSTPPLPETRRLFSSFAPLPHRPDQSGPGEISAAAPRAGGADATGLSSRTPLAPAASPDEADLGGARWGGAGPLPNPPDVRAGAAPVAPDPVRITVGTGPVPDSATSGPVTDPGAAFSAPRIGAAPDLTVVGPADGPADPGLIAAGGTAPDPQPVSTRIGAPVAPTTYTGNDPTAPTDRLPIRQGPVTGPVRSGQSAGTGQVNAGIGPVPNGTPPGPVATPEAGVEASPVAALSARLSGADPAPAATSGRPEGAPLASSALGGAAPTGTVPPFGGPGPDADTVALSAPTDPAPIRRMSPIDPVSGTVLTGWSRPVTATGAVHTAPAPSTLRPDGAADAFTDTRPPDLFRVRSGSAPQAGANPGPTAPAPGIQAPTTPAPVSVEGGGLPRAVSGAAPGPLRSRTGADGTLTAATPARSDTGPQPAAQVAGLGGPVGLTAPVTADPPPLSAPPPLSPTTNPQAGLTPVRNGASQTSPVPGAAVQALTGAPGPVPPPQFDPVWDGPAPIMPGSPPEPISGASPVPGPAASGAGADPTPPLSALLADRTALSRHVARQVRLPSDGETRTQITLRPDGLGKVEVELSTDPNGRLSLLLRVENPTVLQALRADRDGLLMSLERSGLDLGGTQLGFEGFGPGRDPDRDGRRPDPYRMTQAAPTEGPSGPAAPPRRTPLIGGGRIDLFT